MAREKYQGDLGEKKTGIAGVTGDGEEGMAGHRLRGRKRERRLALEKYHGT